MAPRRIALALLTGLLVSLLAGCTVPDRILEGPCTPMQPLLVAVGSVAMLPPDVDQPAATWVWPDGRLHEVVADTRNDPEGSWNASTLTVPGDARLEASEVCGVLAAMGSYPADTGTWMWSNASWPWGEGDPP